MSAGKDSEDGAPSTVSRLLAGLPSVHAAALILHEAGVPDEWCAGLLGVPVESLPTLLDVARRKARRAIGVPMDRGGSDPTEPWPQT